MENEIEKHIATEVNKSASRAVESVELTGVYPNVLSKALGEFDVSEMDTNGWQVDYWISTEKYNVSGSMYYGTATVTLKD